VNRFGVNIDTFGPGKELSVNEDAVGKPNLPSMVLDLNSLPRVVVDITIRGRIAPMRAKYGDARWVVSTSGEPGTDHVYSRTSA
jgi:hypothetical protein